LFNVNVPVLSEQITVALPIVSTMANCLHKAFFLANLATLIERTTVVVTGSATGINEIANAIAEMIVSNPIQNAYGWLVFTSGILKIPFQVGYQWVK
jgi:hypothetical protein